MADIIEIKNLRKNYGDIKAIDDISFSVKEGSLFAFLGVNGAGKSTTIKILCSILKKDSGQILIGGMDLDHDADKIKSLLGVVFQDSVLDSFLSVKENLSIRAGFYGLSKEEWKSKLAEIVELLDLKKILNRPIKNLSGGQRRRVDIARSLINSPKILILDEPTTGLDPQTRVKIWDIIEKLRKKNKMTVFLTTHYMEEANRANMVVMIDKGKIVAHDTPHKLKMKYSKDYIKAYMKKNEDFEREYDGQWEYVNDYYRLNVNGSEQTKEILNRYSNYINDFEVLKGDMDDVFLNITGKTLEGGDADEE